MALPASDTFSGTAGQDLPVYSASWVNCGAAAADCLECDGSGNARAATAGPDNGAKWNADAFTAAQWAETIVDPAGAGINDKGGSAVRCGTAGNFYGAYADVDEVEIFKMVAGTWTQLGATVAVSWGTGTHTIRLEASGGTLSVILDGAAPTTRSDSAHTSGSAGVSAWSGGGVGQSLILSWTADNLPAAPVSLAALGAKSAGVTATPVSVAYPASIAAKDMILAGVNAYNSTATVTTPASPWAATGDLAGGTGTAADSHTGRIHVDQREATGSESGSVSFALGGTISGALGIMAAYRLGDTTDSWDVATTSGTDDTHAANRSVTGSGTIAFDVDDVLVAFVAVDTDTSLTVTSPAFTASGITFGTTSRLTSGAGVTSGNDGNIDVFEATVTAGTGTVAPTLAFTTATSQCGPVVFVRLRAVPSGGGPQTVNLDTGILTLTGVDPTLTATGTATKAVDVGALALAGVQPTLAGTGTATPVTVDVGALALAGVQPSAAGSGAVTTTLDVATLTLAGVDVAASLGGAVVPIDPGILVLSGVDLTAAGTGTAATTIASAVLTLSGVQPTLAATGAAPVAIDPGILALVGATPTIVGTGTGTVAVPTGVLTLVGVAPQVVGGDIIVDVDVGILTLTGVQAALVASGAVTRTLDVATLTLTGVQPAAAAAGTGVVQLDSGLLVLGGQPLQPAGVGTGTAVTVDVGILLLVGGDVVAFVGKLGPVRGQLLIVPGEPRMLVIEAEPRMLVIPAEARILIVPEAP